MAAPDKTDSRKIFGRWGESYVTGQLMRCGYQILARNLKTPAGEVDLLAQQEGELILVEVKSYHGQPAEHRISARQQSRLARAAEFLITTHTRDCLTVRIDLMAVEFHPQYPFIKLAHYKNVIETQE